MRVAVRKCTPPRPKADIKRRANSMYNADFLGIKKFGIMLEFCLV